MWHNLFKKIMHWTECTVQFNNLHSIRIKYYHINLSKFCLKRKDFLEYTSTVRCMYCNRTFSATGCEETAGQSPRGCKDSEMTAADFAGINDNTWEEKKVAAPKQTHPTHMRRQRRQYQQSLAIGSNAFSASSSNSMSAEKASSPSSRVYASCGEYCAAHVRQCQRICLGFSTQIRGLCTIHCKARARACPNECATGK